VLFSHIFPGRLVIPCQVIWRKGTWWLAGPWRLYQVLLRGTLNQVLFRIDLLLLSTHLSNKQTQVRYSSSSLMSDCLWIPVCDPHAFDHLLFSFSADRRFG
jgi:hypothetical protein